MIYFNSRLTLFSTFTFWRDLKRIGKESWSSTRAKPWRALVFLDDFSNSTFQYSQINFVYTGFATGFRTKKVLVFSLKILTGYALWKLLTNIFKNRGKSYYLCEEKIMKRLHITTKLMIRNICLSTTSSLASKWVDQLSLISTHRCIFKKIQPWTEIWFSVSLWFALKRSHWVSVFTTLWIFNLQYYLLMGC